MTRTMQDAVNTANFTAGADIYAGYVLSDSGEGYSNYYSMVARFPDAKHLMICTRFNATADCLDYEAGTTGTSAGDASEAVAWTGRMRATGRTPWNYCNESTWPQLKAAYAAAGVVVPIWWIANTSTGAVMIVGADAHQYSFNLPANLFDSSIVADYIPGFDGDQPSGGGTPITPTPPVEDDDMFSDADRNLLTAVGQVASQIQAEQTKESHMDGDVVYTPDTDGDGSADAMWCRQADRVYYQIPGDGGSIDNRAALVRAGAVEAGLISKGMHEQFIALSPNQTGATS